MRALRQAVSLCRVFTLRPRDRRAVFPPEMFSRLSGDPTTCACCGEQFPAFASALRAVGLASTRPSMRWCWEIRFCWRLTSGDWTRRGGAEDAARRLDALPDPSLRPLVESLVLERTPSQADGRRRLRCWRPVAPLQRAVALSMKRTCARCGERGHVQATARRSDIDEDADCATFFDRKCPRRLCGPLVAPYFAWRVASCFAVSNPRLTRGPRRFVTEFIEPTHAIVKLTPSAPPVLLVVLRALVLGLAAPL